MMSKRERKKETNTQTNKCDTEKEREENMMTKNERK